MSESQPSLSSNIEKNSENDKENSLLGRTYFTLRIFCSKKLFYQLCRDDYSRKGIK